MQEIKSYLESKKYQELLKYLKVNFKINFEEKLLTAEMSIVDKYLRAAALDLEYFSPYLEEYKIEIANFFATKNNLKFDIPQEYPDGKEPSKEEMDELVYKHTKSLRSTLLLAAIEHYVLKNDIGDKFCQILKIPNSKKYINILKKALAGASRV